MKKLAFLLLITFCLVITSQLHGQNTSFGLKGGINLATIGGDADFVSTKVGIHIGAFSQIQATDKLVFQPELVYSAQGASLEGDGKAKYNYLNVPLILKFYPSQQGFHIHAGPQLGLLLSAELSEGGVDLDVKEQLNELDFALGVGVGYDINNIVLDARYNLGLNSTTDVDDGFTYPNRTFQLSFGYKF